MVLNLFVQYQSVSFPSCIYYPLLSLDHPVDLTCTLFSSLFFTPTQTYTAHVFMVLLSIHEGIQLGKYNVYNTLCLQLTFLINCNRNTAISSLIAGRIELYISSLSRTQKLWLPNFQWRWGEERGSFYNRLWVEGKTH